MDCCIDTPTTCIFDTSAEFAEFVSYRISAAMISSRKLRKLFSLELLQSIAEHTSCWTHPVSARRVLATLDRAEFEKLR